MQNTKKIVRDCSVCGDKIKININAKGRYDNGNYFGTVKIPIAKTGEYEKVRISHVLVVPIAVVRWTGKTKDSEYWECDPCYSQALRENWLEETIENYYGRRCKDFEASCGACDVWSLYDGIVRQDALKGTFKQKYDKRANAAYIYIKDKIKPGESARTLDLSDFVNFDFDKKGNLLGIEVLGIEHMPEVFASQEGKK